MHKAFWLDFAIKFTTIIEPAGYDSTVYSEERIMSEFKCRSSPT